MIIYIFSPLIIIGMQVSNRCNRINQSKSYQSIKIINCVFSKII